MHNQTSIPAPAPGIDPDKDENIKRGSVDYPVIFVQNREISGGVLPPKKSPRSALKVRLLHITGLHGVRSRRFCSLKTIYFHPSYESAVIRRPGKNLSLAGIITCGSTGLANTTETGRSSCTSTSTGVIISFR